METQPCIFPVSPGRNSASGPWQRSLEPRKSTKPTDNTDIVPTTRRWAPWATPDSPPIWRFATMMVREVKYVSVIFISKAKLYAFQKCRNLFVLVNWLFLAQHFPPFIMGIMNLCQKCTHYIALYITGVPPTASHNARHCRLPYRMYIRYRRAYIWL